MRRLSRYGWRAAEPARRPVLFVNPRSGGGRAAQAGLVERARERGINALVLGPHHDLTALVGLSELLKTARVYLAGAVRLPRGPAPVAARLPARPRGKAIEA